MFATPVVIKDVSTHFLPHFDEVATCFLFWNYPHPKFIGADEATVSFYNAGRRTPDGQYATEEWIRQHQQLPIGIWGSMLDEHRRPEETNEEYEARKVLQDCAFSLATKLLDIDKNPELASIIRFARKVDNTATAHPRDISSVIKRLHDNRESVKRNVAKWVKDSVKLARIMELLDRQISLADMFLWVEQGIYAKCCEIPQTDDFTIEKIGELLWLQTPEQSENNTYTAEEWRQIGEEAIELDQLLFKTVTAGEYQKFGVIESYRGRGPNGETVDLKIAVVSSDDPRIHRYARYKDQVAVTVQRRRNGSVAIQSNKKLGVRLYDVARVLMTEEARIRGITPPRWGEMRRELSQVGDIWFYFARGEGLFNGARTSPDIEPTKIPFPRLVALVKLALSIEVFDSERSECCLQGDCSSTRARPCPLYRFGLSRCQTIRFYTRQALAAEAAAAASS